MYFNFCKVEKTFYSEHTHMNWAVKRPTISTSNRKVDLRYWSGVSEVRFSLLNGRLKTLLANQMMKNGQKT